ncbi:histidinol-phosphate transaminase [Caloramator sp. E03]|uniref:histidinol-phosphate transaminase n=1 Tax=Caloramator sp. E03 TaxID=2576307 RepID=UPI00110FFEFB|nr:histidinol-phosphate transaminase [Caloramator sp. E03]QCX34561.1 histidinol-phosphate transaminase [Caloramator sp. E03]
MEKLIKKSVYELEAYSAVNELCEIKLDANENPNDLFRNYHEYFLNEIIKNNINRYPDPTSLRLRKELSKYTGIDEDNLICGNGSDEIIGLIINAFVDKGDNVVIHVPTFSMYKITARISGAKVIEVESDEDFNIDINKIIKKANENNAKLIFLCNPNNPTGNVIKRDDILKVLHDTNSIVVVDEAYFEFYGQTVIDKIDEDRLIVIRTLSKAFALAGARIGYAAAATKIINVLNKIRSPYNLNIFSQITGVIMLKHVDDVRKSIDEIKCEKEYILNQLQGLNGIKVYNGCGNFLLIRFQEFNKAVKLLKEHGISVKSFNSDILKGCIRVTIGKRHENDKFINTVKRVVNNE